MNVVANVTAVRTLACRVLGLEVPVGKDEAIKKIIVGETGVSLIGLIFNNALN